MKRISKTELLVFLFIIACASIAIWRWSQPPVDLTDKAFKELVVGILFWIAVNTSWRER